MSHKVVVIDFETRSRCDLVACGQSVYGKHPSTEVMCLCWTFDGVTAHLWHPELPLPAGLFRHVNEGGEVHAHNAGFEYSIWNNVCREKYGFPPLHLTQLHCTAAQCAANGVPRSLQMAGEALRLPIQKDAEGHKAMMKLCKPMKGGEWHEDPQDLQVCFEYCKTDVLAEWQVMEAIPELTPMERSIWLLNERINLTGIPIAVESVKKAIQIVNLLKEQANEELVRISDGALSTVNQTSAITNWLTERGVNIHDLTKGTVEATLKKKDLPPLCRRVLELRQSVGKASVTKFQAMLDRTDDDGRARNTIMYYGAIATGRFSGQGIQTQNIARGGLTDEQVEIARQAIDNLDIATLESIGNPMDVMSGCIRSMIESHDSELLVSDFAAIEARALAWLAGQEDLLQKFREGEDVYKDMAVDIYKVRLDAVDKNQRQIGKMAVLGCGYGLGAETFRIQCAEQAKVKITRKFSAQVIKAYRTKNNMISRYWKDCNNAAILAVNEYADVPVRNVMFSWDDGHMAIVLPSGRKLIYRNARVVQAVAPWSIGYRGDLHSAFEVTNALEELGVVLRTPYNGGYYPNAFVPENIPHEAISYLTRKKFTLKRAEPEYIDQVEFDGYISATRKFGTKRLYGGLIVENITQAVARDLLCDAMLRLDKAGYRIINHVHDEIVAEEMPASWQSVAEFEKIMKQVPAWGAGNVIGVEGFSAKRYKK